MDRKKAFTTHINEGYACMGDSIILGGAMVDGEAVPGTHVKVPLKTMNRHGLIAGATGTGKTKQDGVRLRATVSEFGPVLLSRVLDLNDTQGGVLAVIFKYCDDKEIPLLDLKDLKKVIQFVTDEGKAGIEKDYGKLSTATTGIILRKVMELEQQDADLFFGEISFDIRDLMRHDKNGNGYINIIRLTDIQDKPKLFSTFMLCLLAEIYDTMPERGDIEKPELVIFIDEAHLIFNQAGNALLQEIENIVKLIRSKGVGVFFVTQNPMDVPGEVLAQLGLKVQHALRAFTAVDRKAIKLTAENFPLSDFYKTDEILTTLGIGEAFVTALNEKGIPTPLAATMLRTPESKMDILTPDEIVSLNNSSELVRKYGQTIDRESAYEILSRKVQSIEQERAYETARKEREKRIGGEWGRSTSRTSGRTSYTKSRRSGTSPVVKVLTSATFIRGMLGILKKVM